MDGWMDLDYLVFGEVERTNEGLCLRGARLELALEGLRTAVCHKTVRVEWRSIATKKEKKEGGRTQGRRC